VAADLTGVELKIGRAEAHLADIDQSIKAALDPDLYCIRVEYDPETAKHVYRVHDLPTPDPIWSVRVGEILFNLRSALDHLAWQLVLLDGGDPGEETQFPIRDTPFNKKGDLVRVDLTPRIKSPQILAALDECQPYQGALGEPHPISQNFLWRLRLLNNFDKHRLLLVAVNVLDTKRVYWGREEGDPMPSLWLNQSPLEEGAEVAWFDFGGEERPPHFDPHLTLSVALGEPLNADGSEMRLAPLVTLMNSLCWWIRQYTLERHFRPLFG
jgi:hypothetical protein